MKRSLGGLLLAGVVAVACQTSNSAGSTQRGDIVIASDLATSAYGSDWTPAQQAIAFAIRQQGSIDGFKLAYRPFDDSLSAVPNPVRGLNNVRRMITDPSVLGVIGPASSLVANAEFAAANPAHLAMLSPSNTNTCLTLALSFCARDETLRLNPRAIQPDNYFRIAAPDVLQGRAMGRFAGTALKVRRAAVINMWPGDGDLIIKNFADEFARAGGQLLFAEPLSSDTRDFTAFLKRASAAGAEAIYAVTDGQSETVCAARAQMTQTLFPWRTYFLATDGANDQNCIEQAADNSTGMYYTFSDVDPRYGQDPTAKKSIGPYLKAYPKPSDVSIYTFAAYDCARILIDAIRRAIEGHPGVFPSRPDVVAALSQTNGFQGVTGTYTFDANGDAESPLMSIYTVESGRWRYDTKIDAGN